MADREAQRGCRRRSAAASSDSSIGQHENRAVGQRPQTRRRQRAVGQFLAQERHLNAAMKRRQVVAAARGDGDEDLRVGLEAIRLGERAGGHDAEVAAVDGRGS